ncbi:MAG: hypothetical protein ABJN69_06285 [Hellea sp.]
MREIDLNKKLETYKAPEPSDLLKARILKAAGGETIAAENAGTAPIRASFTRRFMPIAASLLAVCAIGLTVMQSPNTAKTETAAWQEAATDLGFDDIYDWVETEDTATQDS